MNRRTVSVVVATATVVLPLLLVCLSVGRLEAGGAAPPPAEPKSAAYENVCQPCHGREGGGGIGPRLVPMTRTEGEVLAIVREGNGQMPPLSSRDVTDAQVSDIVQYLKSLSKSDAQPKA